MSYSFFGVQVAIRNFKRDRLWRRLHDVLTDENTARQSLTDKRRFWKRITAVLAEATPELEYGDWDLVRGSEAKDRFDEWSSEIEGGLATVAEELGDAADEVNRVSGAPTYLLTTMIVLVEGGSNADQTLGERCDLPESQWLTRQTFSHLLATMPRLNFANVQADGFYLVPGDERDGLSAEDLASPDYRHLSPLT